MNVCTVNLFLLQQIKEIADETDKLATLEKFLKVINTKEYYIIVY